MSKPRFYEEPAFAAFIRDHVLPGNGRNIYRLCDDGSVSEYTNPCDYCPAEAGHVLYSVRRDPEIRTVDGYVGLFRTLDECELLATDA